MIYWVQSKSVSSMLAPVRISACAHMCVWTRPCVSGMRQCQSLVCYYRRRERAAVSLLPHAGRTPPLKKRLTSSLSSLTHVGEESYTSKSLGALFRPLGGLTVVGLQLLFHLCRPCMITQKVTRTCTRARARTHTIADASFRLPAEGVERTSGSHWHFPSR